MKTDVGYGMPPVATRFRKGKSGNPGGKPGPRRQLERQFRQALENALLAAPEAAHVTDPVADWLAGRLVGEATAGNFTALELVLSLLPERGRSARVPARILQALRAPQASAAHS